MSRRNTRFRLGLKGATLVAATLTAAGGTAATAIAAPASHPANARPAASLVPLSQVGPGWSIAEYSAASVPMAPHSVKGKTTLYAVSPQGRKFAFHTWPAAKPGPGTFSVVDWSGDGQRVLVGNFFNKYEQISLATGKVINTFRLPNSVTAIGYTRPHGLNILAVGDTSGGVRRYDLTGKLTKVLTKTGQGAIDSPDGISVIVGTSYGVEQVSNVGGVLKRLHAPVAVSGCTPVRWWNATTVLGQCIEKHGAFAPRLWLFPVNGGKVRALTAQRSGRNTDLGDIDAWRLTSGLYLQALGPCAVLSIAKQAPNGSVHLVPVPGVNYATDRIITGQGSSLLVQAENGCAAGASLVWFNPGTKKVTWVFHAPKNVDGVVAEVPYGRPLS